MISREKFIESINRLREYQKREYNLYHNGLDISEVTDGLVGGYLDLLEEAAQDKGEWISYWCFDLDFGKDWTPDTCTDENGNPISLKTVDDLYKRLVAESEIRTLENKWKSK